MTGGLAELGRTLMVVGGVLVLVGLALTLSHSLPWIGRLPGDILYRKRGFTLYFPLATCILLSLVLTILLSLFRR